MQLELGSEVTNYTPFINIIKEENGYVKESTTFYADDFKCKNMFDKSNIVAGYLSNAGNIVSNTQYSTSNYINVKGIGNITISGSSGNSENICFYDSSQTFISFISTGTNATLTTSVPSNAYYCRITVKNTNLDLVQLEVGSEATPYTPYKNFENEDIYSTNEMVIGTWVDGKPLYRKVIDIGALPNNTTKYVNHNISNVDIITNYYGVCKSSNNIHFKLPYTSVTTTGSIQVYCTNTQIVVQTDADRSGYSGFTIIEYTKTTD